MSHAAGERLGPRAREASDLWGCPLVAGEKLSARIRSSAPPCHHTVNFATAAGKFKAFVELAAAVGEKLTNVEYGRRGHARANGRIGRLLVGFADLPRYVSAPRSLGYKSSPTPQQITLLLSKSGRWPAHEVPKWVARVSIVASRPDPGGEVSENSAPQPPEATPEGSGSLGSVLQNCPSMSLIEDRSPAGPQLFCTNAAAT